MASSQGIIRLGPAYPEWDTTLQLHPGILDSALQTTSLCSTCAGPTTSGAPELPFSFPHVRLSFARGGGVSLSNASRNAGSRTDVGIHWVHSVHLDPAAVFEEITTRAMRTGRGASDPVDNSSSVLENTFLEVDWTT